MLLQYLALTGTKTRLKKFKDNSIIYSKTLHK